MSKNKYSDKVPLHKGFANEAKVIGKVPSTFEKQKKWIDTMKKGKVFTDEEYEEELKKLKEEYGIKE